MHDKSPAIRKAELDTAQKRVIEAGRLLQNLIANEGNAEFFKVAHEVYGISDRTNAAREFFAAWEALIALYSARGNWTGTGTPIAAISPDVMHMLGGLCGHLAVGRIPGPIQEVTGPGQKKPGPEERRDMEVAVTYVAAVRAGKIEDGAPVKTVMQTFGINRRTFEGWANEYSPLDFGDAHPETIESTMKQAGNRYRQAGRSQSAIVSRAGKQRVAAN